MAGGNDGLNTIVPYSNDFYHRARPRIGPVGKSNSKINDEVAFNSNLGGFKTLYDAGELSVIQGVGYPNPNRSHSVDRDLANRLGFRQVHRNWMARRYFDNACSGCDPTVAVNIGRQMPQAFAAKTPKA